MPDPSDNTKSSRAGRGPKGARAGGRKPAADPKAPPGAETVEAWLAQRLEAFGDEPTSETDDDAPTLLVRGRTSPRPPPARIEIPREPRIPTNGTPAPAATLTVTPSLAPRQPAREQPVADPPTRETPPIPAAASLSPVAPLDPGPVTEPVRPPAARVSVSAPPPQPVHSGPLDGPLDGPSLDEDATEHGDEGEPTYIRPSNTWGSPASEPVEVADLGFELPDPPSGEVTKPAATAVEAWDLLGESDGRGFAAIREPTEEQTPPGGWSTPGQPVVTAAPAPPPREPQDAAGLRAEAPQSSPSGPQQPTSGPIVVSTLGHHRSDDEEVVDALIARAEARTPRRRPGAFTRYTDESTSDVDAPTVRGQLDEVFPSQGDLGQAPGEREDTGDLLGETQVDGKVPWEVDGKVPWGAAGSPASDDAERTAWMPQGVPAHDAQPSSSGLRTSDGSTSGPSSTSDVQGLDRGALARGPVSSPPPRTPPTSPSPRTPSPRTPSPRTPPPRKADDGPTAVRRAPAGGSVDEDDRSTRLMMAERFEDAEEVPRSALVTVVWGVVKWGTVLFVILSFLFLMGVITALLLPQLLQL